MIGVLLPYHFRTAKTTSSYHRLECICQCKKTSSWRFCAFHLVCILFYLSEYLLFLIDGANCLFIVIIILSVFSLIGMKRISFFWEYVVPVGHKLLCHHQFFQVIACTLDFLQLQHMLLQLIAALRCSLIQGCFVF